jgi:hypothetical protein
VVCGGKGGGVSVRVTMTASTVLSACITGVLVIIAKEKALVESLVRDVTGRLIWFLPDHLVREDLLGYSLHVYASMTEISSLLPGMGWEPTVWMASFLWLTCLSVASCVASSWLVENGLFLAAVLLPSVLLDLDRAPSGRPLACTLGALALFAPYAATGALLAISSFVRGQWVLRCARSVGGKRRAGSTSDVDGKQPLPFQQSDSDSSPDCPPDDLCYPPGVGPRRKRVSSVSSDSGELLLSSASPAFAALGDECITTTDPNLGCWKRVTTFTADLFRFVYDWVYLRQSLREVSGKAASSVMLRVVLSSVSCLTTLYFLVSESGILPNEAAYDSECIVSCCHLISDCIGVKLIKGVAASHVHCAISVVGVPTAFALVMGTVFVTLDILSVKNKRI